MKVFKLSVKESRIHTLAQINVLLRELSPEAASVSWQDVYEVVQNGRFFLVSNDEQRIVAMGLLATVRKLTGWECRIEELVVLESFRGQGIARQLVQAMIVEARTMNASHIELTSKPERQAANQLYLKMGFGPRETNVYRLDLR